jgi:hypothetical protein
MIRKLVCKLTKFQTMIIVFTVGFSVSVLGFDFLINGHMVQGHFEYLLNTRMNLGILWV